MSDIPFDHQNAAYAQLLYEEFARNPEAVPSEWRAFFDRGPAAARDAGLIVPDGLADHPSANGVPSAAPAPPTEPADDPAVRAELAHLRALLPLVSRATGFIQAYRDHGHTRADINPLGIEQGAHPQLDPSFFGTSMEELDQVPSSVVMEDAREG